MRVHLLKVLKVVMWVGSRRECSLSEGDAVLVTGSIAALGKHALSDAARMQLVSKSHWQLEASRCRISQTLFMTNPVY